MDVRTKYMPGSDPLPTTLLPGSPYSEECLNVETVLPTVDSRRMQSPTPYGSGRQMREPHDAATDWLPACAIQLFVHVCVRFEKYDQ